MNTEKNAADIPLSFCNIWANELRQRMAGERAKTIFRRFCVTIAWYRNGQASVTNSSTLITASVIREIPKPHCEMILYATHKKQWNVVKISAIFLTTYNGCTTAQTNRSVTARAINDIFDEIRNCLFFRYAIKTSVFNSIPGMKVRIVNTDTVTLATYSERLRWQVPWGELKVGRCICKSACSRWFHTLLHYHPFLTIISRIQFTYTTAECLLYIFLVSCQRFRALLNLRRISFSSWNNSPSFTLHNI
jgi:hypothetical protein